MRAADGGDSARFTSFFLASSFFCSQFFIYTRPLSAANANRWAGACIKPFKWFSKLACASDWRLSPQNQVSFFKQDFGFVKVGLFSGGIFQVFRFQKLAFLFSSAGSVLVVSGFQGWLCGFSHSFGKRAFLSGKVLFYGKRHFQQSRVSEIGFIFFQSGFW
jgi:hypothetical protein